MAADVFGAAVGDEIEITNVAAGHQWVEPLRVQDEDHACFHPVGVVAGDVVLGQLGQLGHADGMAEVGMKTSGAGRELGWSGILANTEEKVITVVL